MTAAHYLALDTVAAGDLRAYDVRIQEVLAPGPFPIPQLSPFNVLYMNESFGPELNGALVWNAGLLQM